MTVTLSGLNQGGASSGYSGTSGVSGWSGTSGVSGWSGESGVSGWSGVSGASGTSGVSGWSGTSGASAGIIASSISDGDTTHAPDGNSVFDALALKANLTANTFTAAQTLSTAASQNLPRVTVASHATTGDIWAAGHQIDWTGTATTTIFPNAPQAGVERVLICAGACAFTAGANMLIDGVASAATVTCAANDQVIVRAVSTTQFKLSRVKYDGTAQVNPVATATVAGLVPTPPNNTTTFLRGDATFAAPAAASQGLTLIRRATFSNVANTDTTFDGVFTSAYTTYLVTMDVYASTNNTNLRLNLRVGGSTATAAYYGNGTTLTYGGTAGTIAASAAAYVDLLNLYTTAADKSCYKFTFSGVGITNPAMLTYTAYNAYIRAYQDGGYITNTVEAIDGFILTAGSNTIYGTVSIYGLATS